MAKVSRPLSPHLQIYRWYFTMALSIAHRASGVALSVGLLFLTWWLVALAGGEQSFAQVEWWKDSVLGVLFLVGMTLALTYHFGNGIRHLIWDMGYGFEPETAKMSGKAVLAFAGVTTVLTWIIILIAS